ncbi:MAG TPA: hypothetical protein VIV60_02155 [Polyangiaceae bacterium]
MAIAACVCAYPIELQAANPGDGDSAAAGSAAPNAGTGPVQTCVDSHLLAQSARQDGRLLESRARLRQCAVETCPELVRTECARLLDELHTQIPTVIFRITVDGETRSNVSGYIGERKLFDEIPTRAMEFDPGKYRFRFQFETLKPLERDIAIAEGERYLPIVVAFANPDRSSRKTQEARGGSGGNGVSREPISEVHGARPVPWPVYALSGLGIAGLGGFVGFGLATRGKESSLKSSCSPGCSRSQIDSVERLATLADISLGVGATALATALTYYLLRPTESIRVGAAWLPKGQVHSQIEVTF